MSSARVSVVVWKDGGPCDEAFYRTGSIIFGGGQVVLPLLLKDVVQYSSVCTLDNGRAQS